MGSLGTLWYLLFWPLCAGLKDLLILWCPPLPSPRCAPSVPRGRTLCKQRNALIGADVHEILVEWVSEWWINKNTINEWMNESIDYASQYAGEEASERESAWVVEWWRGVWTSEPGSGMLNSSVSFKPPWQLVFVDYHIWTQQDWWIMPVPSTLARAPGREELCIFSQ